MNLDNPRCARCGGTRMLHVRRVMDHVHALGSASWLPRPIAVVPGPPHPRTIFGERVQPAGYWETLVCRECGLTFWYAFDWQALEQPRRITRPCLDCGKETEQLLGDAVENVANGFEQPRLTRGRVGREGFLLHTICTVCSRADWLARDYAHLEAHVFSAYEIYEHGRSDCLRCGSFDSLQVPVAHEYDGEWIPVAVVERKAWVLSHASATGHFKLRLCRPCGSLEWYALGFEKLEPSVEAQIFAIGDESQRQQAGGPYR